jgi:hypothetical protein
MVYKYIILLLIFSCLESCAFAPKNTWPEGFEIKPSILDEIKKERISIEFHNTTNQYICMDPQEWPDSESGLVYNSTAPVLKINGQIFNYRDFQGGYPWAPNLKTARLEGTIPFAAPGQKITTFLRYNAIDMNSEYYLLEGKQIIASFTGYYC